MQASSAISATLERARELDPRTLSSVEVRLLSREMRASRAVADVRVAFAGNVVFQPLPEFVETHLVCHGMTAASYVAPFGQAPQQLLDPQSALRAFDPNFLVIHFELDAILPGLLGRAADEGTGARRAAVHTVLAQITPTVRAALSMTRATVLLTNFFGPDCYDLGIADSRAEFGEQELYAQLNLELAREFRPEPRVQIVDLCRLTAFYGRGRARDRRLYYVAKIPWHESFVPVLADELVRHIGAALGRIRKCLVVDLDNTLWGGVLGEDGAGGIRVGPGDPVAEAHLDLQRRILALKKRGILLAVCSKNNPDEVEDVFRTRTDMPLQRADFVCMQIGWDMKHEGLRRIAAQLNIGTDSLVFLDDNPAEIDLVRQFLPEVECVLVPQDPAARPECLDHVHGLDRTVITTDDLVRTRQYQENAARASERRAFPSVQRYLQSLQTRLTVETVSPDTLARAQQLFAKTNQFNLTTRRYTHGELETLAADGGNRVLICRAVDQYGDLGWIGALVLREIRGPHAHIENFVLSCRVMGREIETALLNQVKHLCFVQSACASITAECIPNSRNVPVAELYERQGFAWIAGGENGRKLYRLERSAGGPIECDCVALVDA